MSSEVEPYKEVEFQEFCKLLEEGRMDTYEIVGEALGVSNNTLVVWSRLPDARKAKAKGIQHALNKMEQSGEKDWRMWEAKLKILGVNPPQKIDAKVSDPIDKILNKFGLEGADAGETSEASSTTSDSSS